MNTWSHSVPGVSRSPSEKTAVLSRMHCRMTGTQGLSVTGSNDLLSDGKWLLFLKRGQTFSDRFRDAATCILMEDKTLSKRIARSEENEVTIAIPPLEATCHSLNGWWSLTQSANVCEYAQISDNAIIIGYATIMGHSKICDHAKIGGRALIAERAEIDENAELLDSNDYITLTGFGLTHNTITFFRGKEEICVNFCGYHGISVKEFRHKIAASHNHDIELEYCAKEFEMLCDLAEYHFQKETVNH